MAEFNLQEALQSAVSPLNTLAQRNLSIAAEQRAQARNVQNMGLENQFVTARNAANIAQEGALAAARQKEAEKAASELSAQGAKQASEARESEVKLASHQQVVAAARQYGIPTTGTTSDDDDALIQKTRAAAKTAAGSIQKLINTNNAQLASISVPPANYLAAAKQAVSNLMADPTLAAQVSPEVWKTVSAEMAHAAASGDASELAKTLFDKQHGIGSTLEAMLPGPSGRSQAALIQGALEKEMTKQVGLQDTVNGNKTMMAMKALSEKGQGYNNLLLTHYANLTPSDQAELSVQNSNLPSADPSNFMGKLSPGSTPLNAQGNDSIPRENGVINLPPPTNSPISSVPPSSITQHFQNLSSSETAMQRAQSLADKLNSLLAQRADLEKKTAPGAGDTQVDPVTGAPVVFPYQNADKVKFSQQIDALDAQIQHIQDPQGQDPNTQLGAALRQVRQFKANALGVPAPAAPSATPAIAPAAVPTGSIPGATMPSGAPTSYMPSQDILQTMNRLAASDGMGPPQIQALVAGAQAGNPQAKAMIAQYHARAQAALSSQNNPFSSTVSLNPTASSPMMDQTSPSAALTVAA